MNPDETSEDSSDEENAEQNAEEITVPCCSEKVHIAYRGKADDHLYMVYERQWQEVKFFQQNGLRVFCAACRRRVL